MHRGETLARTVPAAWGYRNTKFNGMCWCPRTATYKGGGVSRTFRELPSHYRAPVWEERRGGTEGGL